MNEPVKSYAQSQEDILVWDFFGKKNSGYYVEVGANHPVILNQTWLLEQNGWTGLLVEPQSACCELLRAQRPGSRICQVACSAPEKRGEATFLISDDDVKSALAPSDTDVEVEYAKTETVRVVTLDDILGEDKATGIDFLSVDVEGLEVDVFRGLDFKKYAPRLILVEDHAHNLRTHHFLKGKNYRLVYRTGRNNWYVPEGIDFPLCTPVIRWKLFRKMYVGLPWRKGKTWLKKQLRKK
jgi:FkbM family methyltransferase